MHKIDYDRWSGTLPTSMSNNNCKTFDHEYTAITTFKKKVAENKTKSLETAGNWTDIT